MTKVRTIAGITHVFCAVRGKESVNCDGFVWSIGTHGVDCANRGANNVCTCQIIDSAAGGTVNA